MTDGVDCQVLSSGVWGYIRQQELGTTDLVAKLAACWEKFCFSLEASVILIRITEILSWSKPLLVETNTNGKHRVIIFCLLIKSSCPEGTAFNTQGLFNKQVCLTSSAQPVPGLGLAGCYWLQPAALRDRTSCLLCPRLKASLMAKLAGGPGLQTSSQLQDRKLHTTQSQHSGIKILTSEVHVRIQMIPQNILTLKS